MTVDDRFIIFSGTLSHIENRKMNPFCTAHRRMNRNSEKNWKNYSQLHRVNMQDTAQKYRVSVGKLYKIVKKYIK